MKLGQGPSEADFGQDPGRFVRQDGPESQDLLIPRRGIIARQILMGTEKDVAVSVSTGCFEVSTTIFPYTSWKEPPPFHIF